MLLLFARLTLNHKLQRSMSAHLRGQPLPCAPVTRGAADPDRWSTWLFLLNNIRFNIEGRFVPRSFPRFKGGDQVGEAYQLVGCAAVAAWLGSQAEERE